MSALTAQVAAAALSMTAASGTEPCDGWRSVEAMSHLQFVATYEGAEAPGTFNGFEVCFTFDPGRPQSGRLEVTVDVTTADMGSVDINEEISNPTWLDAGRYPEARFSSTAIEPSYGAEFVAHGTLTLKGVKRDVDVPFTWQDTGNGPVMDGRVILQRTDFEIGSDEWASGESIGINVTVNFSILLEPAP